MVCLGGVCTCPGLHEDKRTKELALSFSHVGYGHRTQIVRLGSKCSSSLSTLGGPLPHASQSPLTGVLTPVWKNIIPVLAVNIGSFFFAVFRFGLYF